MARSRFFLTTFFKQGSSSYLTAALLLAVGTGCGSGDETEPVGPGGPGGPGGGETTPVGTPTGDAATAAIGPEGGSLASADGILTLTIPPGAVAESVEFGIQPITNEAFDGMGEAYRLTPDGQTFATPAQITARYEAEEIVGTVPGALSLAFQDSQGAWEWQKEAAIDTAAATVTISTGHLSDWSRVYGMQLVADKESLKGGEQANLVIKNCVRPVDDGRVYRVNCTQAETDELVGLVPEVNPDSWAVNGGDNDPENGVLAPATDGQSATYTAPSSPPPQNPVAVSVNTKDGELLVANIQIEGGGYHVVMDVQQSSLLPCSIGTPTSVSDHLEFNLVPGSSVVTELQNAVTAYRPPPPSGGLVFQMDSDPEYFTATSGTAAGSGVVGVTLQGTRLTGGCTMLADGTPAASIVGMSTPSAVAFTFDPAAFSNGTQTVMGENQPPDGAFWTIVITEP